jgi:uncharacterized protein HemX
MKRLFQRNRPTTPAHEARTTGHATLRTPDEAPEVEVPETEQPATSKRKSSVWANQVRDLLSGEFLIREGALAQAPYLIFVSFLLVLYVSLGYYYEHLERERQTTERRLEELRAEFKTLQAAFESQLQQSQVERSMADLGLIQSVEAPYLIEVPTLEPSAQ